MTLSGQDVSLDSVGTISLSGAITVPAGFVLIRRIVGLDPGPGIEPTLWFNFTQATSGTPSQFTVAVPDAPDLRLGIAAQALGEGLGTAESWLRGIVPGTPVTVGMDPVPTQVSPEADIEVDLATQTFSWESPVNGVQSLYAPLFVPPAVGPSRSLKYEVFTLARSVRLPLPQELGLSALPPGTKGEWHVGSSNEPSLARLTSPDANVRFGGGVLGVVLPIPEAAEVRFATALAITPFTLR